MNKTIGSIVWPNNVSDAVGLLLRFMLTVIGQLGISFESSIYDPAAVVGGLLSGRLSQDDRRAALAHWWKVVDEKGIRDLHSADVLIARLAICLLSPSDEEAWSLSDQLSWFLEVLGLLGADVDKAIAVMEESFDFVSG